jgi:hypothetical protein
MFKKCFFYYFVFRSLVAAFYVFNSVVNSERWFPFSEYLVSLKRIIACYVIVSKRFLAFIQNKQTEELLFLIFSFFWIKAVTFVLAFIKNCYFGLAKLINSLVFLAIKFCWNAH